MSTTAPRMDDLAIRPPRARLRRLALLAALVLALVAAALYARRWFETGRFIESTDDAFIGADSVTVAPKVAGYVTALLVGDNRPVHAGQVIARIDDRDYAASVAQDQAQLSGSLAGERAAEAQAQQQRSVIDEADANVESDQAQLRFAALESQRAQSLNGTAAGTLQGVQRSDALLRQDVAALKHAQAAQQAAQAQVTSLLAARDYAAASIAKARADLVRAKLMLDNTTITAPIDGIVADRSVRVGAYVEPGLRLLTIVPTGDRLYITANFKETQIGRMAPGQPVRFTVDAFGGHVFHGHVDSVSPGTGAEFALLPPENATGNFTKITQRVPVRVAIEGGTDPLVARLRSGLSTGVDVDTK